MNVSNSYEYSSPTDMNEQLHSDACQLTQRARQDLLGDSRLAYPPLVAPYGGPGDAIMYNPPSSSSSSPFEYNVGAKCVSSKLGMPAADASFPSLPMMDKCSLSYPPPSASSYSTTKKVSSKSPPVVVTSCSKTRRVNFGGSTVINEGLEESICDAEIQQRWWTPEDLDDIKRRAKEMSIRLRQQAKEKGCYIGMAHKKTSLMLTNNFPELVKLSPSSPDQDLGHWCARSDGRRGLERFASREYGICRKDDVLDARDAVFREQERQRKSHEQSSSSMVPLDAESMAKISKEKSRRSRTFSLFMGEADAQAAARMVAQERCEQQKQPSSSKRSKAAHTASPKPQKQQRHGSSSRQTGFEVDNTPLVQSPA